MVKTLRCSSCGAALKCETGQPNVVCEYCNSFVRVADDTQLDSATIISHIAQIWPRVRNDDFTSEYERIRDLIENHKYTDAMRRLDRILEKDNTQARAWFYKSLLPILERETVLFKGCYINIVKVSQITNRNTLRMYLKHCGLRRWQQRKFLDYYRSTDFLFEQHMKYLDKAIEHASTDERIAFFKEHKEERQRMQKRKLRRRKAGTWGLILLLVAVLAGAGLVFWYFGRGVFF